VLKLLLGPSELTTDPAYSDWGPWTFKPTTGKFWVPDIGLCGYAAGMNLDGSSYDQILYSVAQYDGISFIRNSNFFIGNGMAFSKKHGTIHQSGYPPYSIYAFDALTGVALLPALYNGGYEPVTEWEGFNLIIHLGRHLYRVDSGIGAYNGTGSTLLQDLQPLIGTYIPTYISEGGSNTAWLTNDAGYLLEYFPKDNTTGRILRIPDTLARGLGGHYALDGTWCDRTLGVFISHYRVVGASDTHPKSVICVWAQDTVPVSLSVPAATPVPAKAHSAVITATLTGDQGEPCPGWLVDWSASGASGTVDPAQSYTDSTGTATTRYFGPMASGGTETITAEVTE
jgi:hypothetical protein